jgi:DNA-binding XRE family transcriptional regulator
MPSMKRYRTFNGDALRRVRRERFLTQAQLAAKASCSRNIVNRAEVEGKCSDRMSERFANVLGVQSEIFYETAAAPQESGTSATEKRVLEIMRSSANACKAIWHFALGVESSSASQ